MEEEKAAEKQGRMTKKQQQQQLDFESVTGPREFTRTGVLQSVAKLVATVALGPCRQSRFSQLARLDEAKIDVVRPSKRL